MIKCRSACIEFPVVCDESKMKSGIGYNLAAYSTNQQFVMTTNHGQITLKNPVSSSFIFY